MAEKTWIEVIGKRTRTSKTFEALEDSRKRCCEAQVGTSKHYKDALDQWQEVDPTLVPSEEADWDWEMQKSHWRLLIKNSGWIAIERGGVGFGFKLIGWTFLNIATKEYDTIRNATYPTPTVTGKQLIWAGIYSGVDYKLIVGPDGMGYSILIPQSVRDSIPPPPYPAEDTFFVYAYQVKWQDCPYIADAEHEEWLDDRDAPFEPKRGVWLADAIGKVKAWLPLGWVLSVGEDEPLALKHRYIKKDTAHYLLIGARWDTLKGLPSGDIVLSSNIDLGFFRNG